MKTNENTCLIRSTVLAIAVLGLLAAPYAANSQPVGGRGTSPSTSTKGAEQLLKLSRIQSETDLQSVQAGDTIVMSCPKCKDIWVRVVEPTFKGGRATQVGAGTARMVSEHLCPGCGTTRVTSGHGKTKTTTLVHTCSQCGSEDVNCCVMKKGGGPTMGMN
jgi:ribosomal protein L44E